MTNDQIIDTLALSRSLSSRVWLMGYTSEDGKVSHYKLALHNGDYYGELVDATVKELVELTRTDKPLQIKLGDDSLLDVPADVVRSVAGTLLEPIKQKQASFKSSNGGVSAFSRGAFVPILPGETNLFTRTDTPDMTGMLRNVEVLEEVVEIPAPAKTSTRKPKAPPPPPTTAEIFEKHVKSTWSLNRYRAMFALKPGKFKTVLVAP